MTIRDLNDFIEGYEHEAQIKGAISFGEFRGQASAAFPIDDSNSVSIT